MEHREGSRCVCNRSSVLFATEDVLCATEDVTEHGRHISECDG